MSNLADLINDIGNSNAKPVALLGDTIGTIADVAGAVGAVISIFSIAIQLIGQGDDTQDELQQILTTIQNDFQQLQAEQQAENIIQRLTNLANALAPAQAVLDTLQVLLDQQPPLTGPEAVDEIQKCITAINDLTPDVVWTGVYSDQIYWTDVDLYPTNPYGNPYPFGPTYPSGPAYGEQAPVAGSDDLVFSYTYILPAYLDALFIFLSVAASLDQNFVADYANQVIRPAAALLQTRHDTILNQGITQLLPPFWDGSILWTWMTEIEMSKGVGAPAPGVMLVLAPDLFGPASASIEYGAVEVFSGYSAMADYNVAFSREFSGRFHRSRPLQQVSNSRAPKSKRGVCEHRPETSLGNDQQSESNRWRSIGAPAKLWRLVISQSRRHCPSGRPGRLYQRRGVGRLPQAHMACRYADGAIVDIVPDTAEPGLTRRVTILSCVAITSGQERIANRIPRRARQPPTRCSTVNGIFPSIKVLYRSRSSNSRESSVFSSRYLTITGV